MSTANLIVSQPGQRTRRVEIAGRTVSIGRRADNSICLEGDTNVSKYHAVIEARGRGEFWLSDLGSSNGTTLNNELVRSERRLQDGDLICIGGTSTLEFHLPAPAAQGAGPTGGGGVTTPPLPGGNPAPIYNNATFAMPAQPAAGLSGFTTPPPSPPAAQKLLGLPSTVVIGIAAGSVVAAAMIALLFAIGAIGGSNSAGGTRTARHDAPAASKTSAPDDDDNNSAGAAAAAADAATTTTPPVAQPEEEAAAPGAAATTTAGGREAATASLARTLAIQISQKSFYTFDPGFVALINKYTNEYRGAKGFYERARRYQEALDREFVNVQGIQPPLIGYVMAMSQSKFIEKEDGGGVWQLPIAVARDYAPELSASDLSDPAKSTRIAAAYMKSLLDLFERENFMYAVACYGLTLDEAGKVRTELEKKDPGGQNRYDFWKMKNAGVVRGEQVERVARFFAAGIVCENPRHFDLNEKQLSSLY